MYSNRTHKILNSINIDSKLEKNDKKDFLNLCSQFEHLFYFNGDKLSFTTEITHQIPTPFHLAPINQKKYRLPHSHKKIIEDTIEELLHNNIIEHSTSPWNSPLLVVNKKPDNNGNPKHRVVVDFRKLNSHTLGDAYPLPRIDDILDQLSNSKYFSTLDLASGYHQVLINKQDKEKTAFSTAKGHFHFLRMPFGLKGAPATFQRLINNTLQELIETECFVYLDDIVIYSHSVKEHLNKLHNIFKKLDQAKLKLQPQKCHFFKPEIIYLGHKCSANGCEPDPEKTRAIQDIKIPKNVKEIQCFLGITNYYRRFIPNFAKLSIPLVKLTRKKNPFNWTEECNSSFKQLKQSLISNNLLAYPNFEIPFEISTDASNEAIEAILSQNNIPIAFASKTLNKTESKYSTIEKELLGVVWGVKRFRCYVYGQPFTVFTDHKPLLGIHKLKDPSSRLLRLYLKLSEYSITLEYKPGKYNTVADALSRLPTNINVITRSQAKHIIEPKEKNFNEIENFFTRSTPTYINTKKQKKNILKLYHDSKLGGHQGCSKTYHKIKRYYFWPNMKKDIEQYIKSCNICQLNKSGKNTRMQMLLSTPAEYPFEKIFLDVVGPLPVTNRQNKYILTVMDDLSRYMNAYPIHDQEANTITHTFISQVLAHHKTPKYILTDQGTNFTSKTFKNICKLFNIKKLQTTPYHPQTNGALERHHKPLADYLRAFSKKNPEKWDDLLPYAMYVHNNSKNAATKIAPNDCLFGYISEMPSKLKRKPEIQNEIKNQFHNLYHELHNVWKWVKGNQEKYKEITKTYYDKKINEISFQKGDKVYVRNEARKHKLSPLWTGPHEVIGTKSKVTTIIKCNNKIKAIHNNRLKPHYPRSTKFL